MKSPDDVTRLLDDDGAPEGMHDLLQSAIADGPSQRRLDAIGTRLSLAVGVALPPVSAATTGIAGGAGAAAAAGTAAKGGAAAGAGAAGGAAGSAAIGGAAAGGAIGLKTVVVALAVAGGGAAGWRAVTTRPDAAPRASGTARVSRIEHSAPKAYTAPVPIAAPPALAPDPVAAPPAGAPIGMPGAAPASGDSTLARASSPKAASSGSSGYADPRLGASRGVPRATGHDASISRSASTEPLAPPPASEPHADERRVAFEPAPPAPAAPPASTAAPPQVALPAPVAPAQREIELLDRAHAALRAADPGRALAIAGEHERLYARGALAQEREVIAIEALVRLGRAGEARTRVGRFRSAWPGSSHLRRLDALGGEGAGAR